MLSRLSITIVNLKFMEFFQSIVAMFQNNFTHIITFLSTNAAQDLAVRTLVLSGTKPSVPQAVINVVQSVSPHTFQKLR